MLRTFILLTFTDKVSPIDIFHIMQLYHIPPYTDRHSNKGNGNEKLIQ